jgi:streptogramin lyase
VRFDTALHTFTAFAVPTSDALPYAITPGPDGALWFTEQAGNKVGRFDLTTQSFDEFSVPTSASKPTGIAAGPDGKIWFTEAAGNQVAAIDPSTHAITEVPLPSENPNPTGITAGPDGKVWFTEIGRDEVGVIDPATHTITEIALPPTGDGPRDDLSDSGCITAGPDGKVWVGTNRVNLVLLSPDPHFPVGYLVYGSGVSAIDPTTHAVYALGVDHGGARSPTEPVAIAAGPGGSIWDIDTNTIIGRRDRITTTALSAESPTSRFEEPVTFTAVVNATGLPPRSVSFTIDEVAQPDVGVNAVDGRAQAELTVYSLAPGRHTIQATYRGYGSYDSSVSSVWTQVVTAGTAIAVAVTPGPWTTGQPVTFTATVTPTAPGTPTGSVTFVVDGVPQTAVALTTAGGVLQASFTTTAFAAGTHMVSAAYSGDGVFDAGTSAAVTLVVQPAVTGPTVERVSWLVIPGQPTRLVITFDRPLDRRTARTLRNYRISDPKGRRVPIAAAVYKWKAQTVTLRLNRRLKVRAIYHLTIIGTGSKGLTDGDGHLLDGAGSGHPGSNDVVQLDHRVQVRPSPKRPGRRGQILFAFG